MKRFLVKTLIFLLGVAVMMAAGEYAVRRVPNSYRYKYEALQERGDSLRTLVMGTSHTYFGIDPSLLSDSALNVANVSQTARYNYLLLSQNIDRLPRLQTVIMSVGYADYTDPPLADGEEWYRVINYEVYQHMGQHSPLSRYSTELAHPAAFGVKLKEALGLSHNPDAINVCNYYGQSASPMYRVASAGWEQRAAADAERQTAPPTYEVSNLADYRELAAFCRDHGLRLVLVSTPLHRRFREATDTGQMHRMERLTRSLVRDYPGTVWLDFRSDARFTDDDFTDASHLNTKKGSAKLTSILADTLKKLR